MKLPSLTSPQTLTYVSDGDANGVLYFRGTNNGVASWNNPHTAGRIVHQISSNLLSSPVSYYCDREGASHDILTNDTANSWATVDLGSGNALTVSKYTLRNRVASSSDGSRAIRNWKLQGSNNPASNSVADLNAATWVDLDTRVGDTTMPTTIAAFATYTVGGSPAAYRWFRIYQNGVNANGDNFLAICEMEFYGVFTF